MTRRLRCAVAVIVGLSAVACVPETPVTPQPSPNALALDRAGDWVLTQFNAAGYLPSVWDPAVSETGNGVLGVANLAALGKGTATASTRLSYLEGEFEEYVDFGDGPRPGALARVIMAVVAAGGNPRSFGGTDLVARLEATLQPSGLFGTQSAQFDGAFRQGLALAALSIVTPRPATITPGPGQTIDQLPAIAWLRGQQCDDGSWLMFRASTVGDCVENPATWTFKDSNGSALATLGLSAVGATADVDPALWFNSVRGNDGGWGTSPAGPATASDADSSGLVIAALESLGDTVPESAYQALLSFQLGDGAPVADRGAFIWTQPSSDPNRLATMDAITALYPEVWPGALKP